jgi:hypothetical protein
MSIEDIEKVISSSSCAYVAAKEIESMIAAHDKGWIAGLQKFLVKDDGGNYYLHPTAEFHEWWQERKKEIGIRKEARNG